MNSTIDVSLSHLHNIKLCIQTDQTIGESLPVFALTQLNRAGLMYRCYGFHLTQVLTHSDSPIVWSVCIQSLILCRCDKLTSIVEFNCNLQYIEKQEQLHVWSTLGMQELFTDN